MLTSLDFHCTWVLDGKKWALMSSKTSFCEKFSQGDCVLVYFSGHGQEDKVRGNESSLCHYFQEPFFGWLFPGRNYIILIHRGDETIYLEYHCICVEDILKRLNLKKDIINIIILDACRADENNTTFKKSRFSSGRDVPAFGKSLSNRADTPDDAQFCIVYSCNAEKVSLGSGPGENSFFTAALLRSIDQLGLAIEDVIKEISKQLKRSTGGKQRSWLNSCLIDSFLFNSHS